MKNYKEPLIPKRLKSPKHIIEYILYHNGNCTTIRCMYCPLSNELGDTVRKRCGKNFKERFNIAMKKALQLKVIKEDEVFDYLL